MKTFKNSFFESNCLDTENNIVLNKGGVTNHYTPVQNILTNINNLFCVRLSIAAAIGEDGISIKLSSSKFTNEKTVDDLLFANLYNDVSSGSSLYTYITSQGLTKVSKINMGGGYWIVYFSPNDIETAQSPEELAAQNIPAEACESLMSEFEYTTINEDDSEEEMKSQTVEKVLELLDGPDKVKAAKQLELLVSNEIQLPREFYFSAIKFKSGEEAIALRWKYTKKMPFGKAEDSEEYKEITIENTRSLMHIFGKGKKAIWVQDFAEDSLVKLPEEVKKLIESILDLLEANKTDDSSIFSLTGERKERDDKDDKKEDDEDKKDDKKEDDKKEDKKDKDDEDDEDDDSRGDSSDDLL